MRRYSLFLLIVGLLSLLALATGAYAGGAEILFTACTNGVMENCGCPNDPLGAMEKRSSEIMRRRQLGDVLLLDSGDFVPPLHDTVATPFIVEAMRVQEYDAIGLGDQELIQGPEMMALMMEKLPIVNANLVYSDTHKPVAKHAYRIIEKGGEKYFVTAILDKQTLRYMAPRLINYVTVLDPDSALEAVLKHAPADAKVIVLSHAGEDIDAEKANQWKGVDLIIGGHSQSLYREQSGMDRRGKIPVVQCGSNARYLGVAQFKGSRVRTELITIKREFPDDQRILDQVVKLKSRRRQFGDSYSH